MPEKKTFFISRAGADKRWAELIASVVRDAGHEPFFEDEDFHVGQNIIDNMTRAAKADCTIAVLSPAYLESEYCLSELNAALWTDPLGRRGQVIPVRVAPVDLPSPVAQLAYVDFVGVGDDIARQRLLKTILKHGQVDASKFSSVGRTQREIDLANRNRSAMIEKVRTIWISGFLEQSRFTETRILLGLNERPDAVARPLDVLVRRLDVGERALPPGTRLVDVFDRMDHSILILGAPGSGKTTLLLELARDLLDRATNDPIHPIPVVFPLSTWSESRKSLLDWIRDELNLRYDVPRAIAQEWVATDQVLPLLDGLDEVKAGHRPACVEAINAFRQSHGFLPLAITSRTTDYEAVAEPLRLRGAILVRPLTQDQVNAYLADLGPAGEPVRSAIQEDSSLWDMLDSPLLLNIATITYASRSEARSLKFGLSSTERRDELFRTYVDLMFRRRGSGGGYSKEQTVRCLSWLASQMVKHGQTVFYLERLQHGWLQKKLRWAVDACSESFFGFVFGVITAGAPLIVFNDGKMIIWGLFFGLLLGLIMGIRALTSSRKARDITCVETVRWSWPGIRWNLVRRGVMIGMILGLVSGLAVAFFAFRKTGQYFMLLAGPLGGLFMGLMLGVAILIGSLLGELLSFFFDRGLTFPELDIRTVPNEGIIRSARNAFLGLLLGLLVGPGLGLLYALQVWSRGGNVLPAVRFGALYGTFFVGAAFGMRAGGEACFKHYSLRLLLILSGSTPWNYVKFLNYASDSILLRKVGGGYMFLHRMLLEWFAKQYVEPVDSHEMAAKAIVPSREAN
jgi:DNA polymerase III delta prime subunit